eukprot:TRINITY_DN10338_c0_g1_i1.p1 TRINITY_DN10338_c0_g1~~TRINITY_DN10338_c0_g1_i1.p1  ORF type:complete len:665 (+),score=221.84 TRINITY_DN10338_c0_g1_i1:97-2091(+)
MVLTTARNAAWRVAGAVAALDGDVSRRSGPDYGLKVPREGQGRAPRREEVGPWRAAALRQERAADKAERRARPSDGVLVEQLKGALRRAPRRAGRSSRDLDDAARRRRNVIVDFLHHHRKNGSQLGWRTYEAALFELADMRQMGLLEEVMKQAEAAGVVVTAHMQSARLKCLLALGKHQEMLGEYAKLKEAAGGGPLSLPVEQAALKAYAATGDEGAAVTLFAELHRTRSDALSAHYYGVVLSAARSYETACNVFELAVINGVRLEARFMNILLNFLAGLGDIKAALAVADEMHKAGGRYAPTTTTYNTLIRAYKTAADPLRCLQVKAAMVAHGVPLDAFTYATVLSVLYHSVKSVGAAAAADHAEAVFADFLKEPRRVVDSVRVWGKMAELLGAACREDALQALLRQWMDVGPKLTKGSLAVVRKAYALCGSDKVFEIELLQRDRNAYYEKKMTGRPLLAAPGLGDGEHIAAVEAAVDKLDGATEQDAGPPILPRPAALRRPPTLNEYAAEEARRGAAGEFEGKGHVVVLFGVPSATSELQVIQLLAKAAGAMPQHLCVVHGKPDTVARVYARFPSAAHRDRVLALHRTRVFGQRILLALANPGDIHHDPTPAQAARLQAARDPAHARRAGLHTRLADSIFKPQVGKKVPSVQHSRIPRGLQR